MPCMNAFPIGLVETKDAVMFVAWVGNISGRIFDSAIYSVVGEPARQTPVSMKRIDGRNNKWHTIWL